MNRGTRLVTLLVGLLVLSATTLSQVVGKPSKGFFYKVSSPEATAYLLGSIHLAPQSMYPLPKEIEDAFTASKTLNVEVDMSGVGGPAGQLEAMQKLMASGTATYTGDDDLWKHVDKTTGHKLRDWCNKHGFPSAAMGHLKPWVVSSVLLVISAGAIGMDPSAGIDMHFMSEASEAKKSVGQLETAAKGDKPVAQIETMESQIKLLASAPEKTQIADLKQQVDHLGDMKKGLQELLDLWLSGNEKAAAAEAKDISSDPATTKKLLEDRNLTMSDFIDSELKAGTGAFVVVGAAHMVGEKGMIATLRKRGYTITQEPITWTHTVKLAGPTKEPEKTR